MDYSLAFSLFIFTGFTFTQLAQKLMRIEPGTMPVTPVKLNGIKSHSFEVSRADFLRDGTRSDQLFSAPFINTIGAGATFP